MPLIGAAQVTDYCSSTSSLISPCESGSDITPCANDGYVIQLPSCVSLDAVSEMLAETSFGLSLERAGARIIAVQPSGLALIRFPPDVPPSVIKGVAETYTGLVLRPLMDQRIKPLFSRNFVFNARQGSTTGPVFTPPSNWALQDIGVGQVPPTGKLATTPLVLVIDDGVHCEHPELVSRLWHNEVEFAALQANPAAAKGHDDDGNGYADDYHGIDAQRVTCDASSGANVWVQDGYVGAQCSTRLAVRTVGHGTDVGGIIAADSSNGAGIDGVSATAKLVYCRGGTFDGGISYFALAACMDYAKSLKSDQRRLVAVNFSYSARINQSCEIDAVMNRLADDLAALRSKGILFVAAAGDENDDVDSSNFVYIPAAVEADNLIVVGRSDSVGVLDPDSNYGNRSVHLLAPGNGIWITDPPDGIVVTGDGTSWSTGFVSGAAAVVADFVLKSGSVPADKQWIAVRNRLLAGGRKDPAGGALVVSDRRLLLAGTGGVGATTCTDQKIRTWLTRDQTTGAGLVRLRAISINCANPMPEDPVTKTVSAHSCADGVVLVQLKDDGVAPDQTADDGVYAGNLSLASGASHEICLTGDSNGTVLKIQEG